MSNDRVTEIVEKLQQLRIAHRREEEALLRELQNAAEDSHVDQKSDGREETENKWKEGDRVRITNRIRHVDPNRANVHDRNATVLRAQCTTQGVKVYLKTDNGHETWRLEKHLRRLVQ